MKNNNFFLIFNFYVPFLFIYTVRLLIKISMFKKLYKIINSLNSMDIFKYFIKKLPIQQNIFTKNSTLNKLLTKISK